MHFLGANRTLPTGFAIFSSTVLKLRGLDVCFIATSKIYDCLSIQIGTFSHFIHTKIHVHFSDLCRHATFYTQSCLLVARYTKLALRYFLAQWIYYLTLKSVSSQRQNSTIGGGFKYTHLLTFDLYNYEKMHFLRSRLGTSFTQFCRLVAKCTKLATVDIINIGTNDLSCDNILPASLAARIVECGKFVAAVDSAAEVLICQLLPRLLTVRPHGRHLKPTRVDFNNARFSVNRSIEALTKDPISIIGGTLHARQLGAIL